MHSCKHLFRNSYGAATIFLSIIITSIIFVESTYIIFIANLDRRLTYSRAVSMQVETYLSLYDRQMFETFGIYAFNAERLDDNVFSEILASNGIYDNAVLVVSGIDEFDTEDLRKAISTFYSYRASAVLFDYFRDQITELIDTIDEYGVVERVQSFLQSIGEPILRGLLEGTSKLSDFFEMFEDSENQNEIGNFIIEFSSLLRQYSHSQPEVGDNYQRGDLFFGIEAIEFVSDSYELSSDIIENVLFHPYCAHYATYNFDSRLERDETINGTELSEFHEGNINDVEYILTGFEGNLANNAVSFMIFQLLFVKNIVNCLLDTEVRSICQIIGSGLCLLLAVVTEGALTLPPEVYEFTILFIYSIILASVDLDSLLRGESISFFSYEDLIDLNVSYKDLIYFYMNYIPDGIMLDRMVSIFNRDFPQYACGISVSCSRPLYDINVERSYDLYA